jgi:hypothetical protein
MEVVSTAAAEVGAGAGGLGVVPWADGEVGAAAADDVLVVVEVLRAFDSCDVAPESEGTMSQSNPSVFGGGSVAEMACRSVLHALTKTRDCLGFRF